jgi:tyrosyl-tRNA synthetase
VGGSDQWGNLVDGASLVRRLLLSAGAAGRAAEHGESGGSGGGGGGVPEEGAVGDVVGITCPLLVDSRGEKLGKSTGGGAVWLDGAQTTPFELFQFFRRVDDCSAATMLRQLTDLPLRTVAGLQREQQRAPAVSRSFACIGWPCLRHCVHGASIGGGGVGTAGHRGGAVGARPRGGGGSRCRHRGALPHRRPRGGWRR